VTSVRIACAQYSPRVGELERNRELSLQLISQTAGVEARIIVLPELMTSGYVFESVEEARGMAEPADGPTVSAWTEFAARHGRVIVGGFAELGDDGAIYNSAAVAGPDGLLAVYRKTHLWDAVWPHRRRRLL
jgi:predicted amidohydrolase